MSRLYDALLRSNQRSPRGLSKVVNLSPEDVSLFQDVPSYPGQVRTKANPMDWLRALKVMRKHWRWSTAFAAVVIVGVTVSVFMMKPVGSSRVDLQACKLEYSIVSPK